MSLENLLKALNNDSKEACYPARVSSLASRGFKTKDIEKGISETIKVLEDGVRSFVVYGEPQSGKTEFMIALACKLIDLDYQTIFVVMNDNTELEGQNFDRFHAAPELNPTPLRDFQIPAMSKKERSIKKQRIIFCRKNSKNLQKIIDLCRYMDNRIVIDDEADFASPNTKINKSEVTAINKYLGILGQLSENKTGKYIGVTATPARLDLNNTFLNDAKSWIFLGSHQNYKGRSFFFPVTQQEADASDYQLVKLPEEGDDPRLLRHAVFRFLIRVSLLNINPKADRTAYSMLVHTAGNTNDHEKDQQDIQGIIGVLSDPSSRKFKKYLEEILRASDAVIDVYSAPYTSVEIAKFIVQNIGKSEILVINHKHDSANVKRAGQPKSLFTFAIGGNIVSRGLTFENLLTFYFSRNVKGKLQQNTYIQRARMFGNRPYSKYFELCVPGELFSDWATCFQDHELSLRMAKAGVYQHIQSGSNRVVDKGAIDKENVTVENSERIIGTKLKLTEEIGQFLITQDIAQPLATIRLMLSNGMITHEHFPKALLAYIDETSENESGILMVLRSEREGKVLQNINRYKSDGNQETITRKRGGIIHAMLNDMQAYNQNSHFILPIKNDLGEFRFLYKTNLGHQILQNLKGNKPLN